MPVRLLSGFNTAIENLSRFIEIIRSPLTEVMQYRIKDTSRLLYIIVSATFTGVLNLESSRFCRHGDLFFFNFGK